MITCCYVFVKNSVGRVGALPNLNLSKNNLSKIGKEGGWSTLIWIMSLNILSFIGRYRYPLVRIYRPCFIYSYISRNGNEHVYLLKVTNPVCVSLQAPSNFDIILMTDSRESLEKLNKCYVDTFH